MRYFFLTLKETSTFGWTIECEQEFGAIKRYLTELPILSSPKSGEELYMYLAVSDYVVSVVLFCHIRDKEQKFVYYISKAMLGAKTQYSQVKHTTLALKDVAQKLHPYF